MEWKEGEKYLVRVTNSLFENFGKVVEVVYYWYSPEVFCFATVEDEGCVEEYYCDEDFVLVEEEVDKMVDEWVEKNKDILESCSARDLVKAVVVDMLKMK